MRKSIISKLSMGAACAAALTVANTQAVLASSLSDTVSMMEPGVSLVMPFDATTDHVSYELVSRKGGAVQVMATHWSFWSDSCDHLGDVFICLTDNDTVVVDPTNVQSQIQKNGTNINLGKSLDFTDSRGFITVSQFEADPDADSCRALDPSTLFPEPSLVGSWVIGKGTSNAAFGNNAIALTDTGTPQALPDPAEYFTSTSGVQLQFFNPEDLNDSEVYVIGIGSPNGNGEFKGVEIGPIPALLPDGHAVCCNAEYFDNIETNISLPDLCFTCASFTAITEGLADADHEFLIPDSKAPNTSGFLSLNNCTVGDGAGSIQNINQGDIVGAIDVDGSLTDVSVFLFSFHGMAVGPFGTSANGKYTSVAQ